MSETAEILLITAGGLFIGGVGTGLGGLCVLSAVSQTAGMLIRVLGFSAALMFGISFFDLLPHALGLANALWVIAGFLIGGVLMVWGSRYAYLKTQQKKINPSRMTALHMAVGIGLHNIPEGLAIGAAFRTNFGLALSLSFAIFIHNLPEGMALSVPARVGGLSPFRSVGIAVLAGLPLGIGALAGALAGGVSDLAAALSLSLAAGVMTAIVFFDIVPEILRRNRGRLPYLSMMAGLALTLIIIWIFH